MCSSENVIAIMRADPKKAEPVIQRSAMYLGLSVANLFTLYNPDFIVLDGKAIAQLPGFFTAIKNETRKFFDSPFNLLQADYRHDAAAIGAAMITIDKMPEEILFPSAN